VYTLVSASVLALDLVRHPAGAAVADVLDSALVLDRVAGGQAQPRGVVDLDRAAARQRLLAVADRAPRLGQALRSVALSLSSTTAGAATGAVDLLQTTLLGRLDDLVVLLEDELSERRALPRPVVDAVVDGAVAAWCAPLEGVQPADVRTLRASWSALVGELPPPPPASGAVPALLELLEAVARADGPVWRLLETTHDVQHAPLRWSELLHVASRAAVQHERTVDVARWQLSAVRAASVSGPPATAAAPTAVMSLVAAVQALALRDVLPAPVVEGLVAPCRLALGLARA
jgi:hypothetical protein